MNFKTSDRTVPLLALLFAGLVLCASTQAQRTATALPTVVNGFIVAITITDGGAGYTNAPAVTITGGGGNGATAITTVLNGAVDKVIVQNAGSGYIGTPIVAIAAPPLPKPPYSDGLLAYYPFNGNADDQSGNSYNGTVFGATLAPDRFGIANRAYHFFQLSDHIAVPIDFKNSQNITISAWVKFDTQNKGQSFFNCMGVFHGINLSYDPNGAFQFFIGGYAGNVFSLYYAIPDTNTWHLYVGTYNGQTVKLFYDATLVASEVYGGDVLYAQTWPCWIGNYSPGPALPLQGSIDDVRVYGRALSDQEAKDLYYYEAPEPSWLTINVKTVQLTMHVKPMKKYQLEASLDMKTWSKVGEAFVASTSEVTQDFNVMEVGRYFQLVEVP